MFIHYLGRIITHASGIRTTFIECFYPFFPIAKRLFTLAGRLDTEFVQKTEIACLITVYCMFYALRACVFTAALHSKLHRNISVKILQVGVLSCVLCLMVSTKARCRNYK